MECSFTFSLLGVTSAYDHIVDTPAAGLWRDKLGRFQRGSVNIVDHLQHVRRYVDDGLLYEPLRYSVVRCGDSSGNGSLCISITAKVDSLTDDILVIVAG